MLPMLLGLAGSGLAGAGMLGGMGALTAGALGSGLGSYIETGDLGQGIQTGLMSFLGGKALGSLMGSGNWRHCNSRRSRDSRSSGQCAI